MDKDTSVYRRPEPLREGEAPEGYQEQYQPVYGDGEGWQYAEPDTGYAAQDAPVYEPLPDDDENEALDNAHRFRIAMNVFDAISVIAGLMTILVLVALLVSLVSWLRTDITHSFTLLQTRF